jgi:hypothetical protein
MSSPAQRRANRRNAQKSTGPRSSRGKAIVARNAHRHGLSLPVTDIPEADATASQLTKLIAGGKTGAECLELARRVADAQADLLRARHARVDLLERPPEVRPRSSQKHIRAVLRVAVKVLDSGGDPFWGEQLRALQYQSGEPVESSTDPTTKLASRLTQRAKELERVDRYERRAMSRLKMAIRAFDSFVGCRPG